MECQFCGEPVGSEVVWFGLEPAHPWCCADFEASMTKYVDDDELLREQAELKFASMFGL